MPSRKQARRLALAALALLLSGAPLAQSPAPSRDSPNRYPSVLPPRKGPLPPRFALRVEAEIPIPAPLHGSRLALAGDRVRFETEGGPMELEPRPGAEPAPAGPATGEPSWVAADGGRVRVRTLPEGRVEAQKRSRWAKSGWKRAWSLRASGRTPSPPALLGRRVFFGSVDGQVHCVRIDNGHRAWAVDVGDRVSMAIAAGTFEPSGGDGSRPPLEFVLAVPDEGSQLVALDAYDGSRLVAHEVAGGEMLVTPPVLLPDRRVAVGRVAYVGGGAVMLVLRMEPLPEEEGPGGDGAIMRRAEAGGSPREARGPA